jgi:hypothetical protein
VKAEVLSTIPAYTVYLRAMWNTLIHPNARTLPTWCRAPQSCKLQHKVVFVIPPHKPVRVGFKHVEV